MGKKQFKFLIVEDDFVSRRILRELLEPFGECDVAKDGEEAVSAFNLSLEERSPYDLICMDIMMPGLTGHEALEKIREIEKEAGVPYCSEVHVAMVTALDDPKNVIKAFHDGGAAAYIVKPIEKEQLLAEVRKLHIQPAMSG